MQSNHLDIYKMVAEEKGTNEQVYKDIGSFIFKEAALLIKNPKSLIIKLKGIGSWHLRKKRMEILVNEWTDRSTPKGREEFTSDSAYQTYLDKHTQYINFVERLKEYDKYLAVKETIRTKRFETQVQLTGIDKDEKFKSE
jgi:hypothetical protein